tara:strand:- start:803 stop:1033 length:231 start_codon:yes stop_codon:yes gene_type:complete
VFLFKKLLFTVILNSFLLFILIIGTQNSLNKVKVNLIVQETIELPTGFIVGCSFILGSLLANLVPINQLTKKNRQN